MSRLPSFHNNPHAIFRPRLSNPYLSLGMDMRARIAPVLSRFGIKELRWAPLRYYPWRSAPPRSYIGSSTVADEHKFEVKLNVKRFAPDKITVKVKGTNTIVVKGMRYRKRTRPGCMTHCFVRRYVVPEGHDINKIGYNMSPDDVLSVTVPRVENSDNPNQVAEGPMETGKDREVPEADDEI